MSTNCEVCSGGRRTRGSLCKPVKLLKILLVQQDLSRIKGVYTTLFQKLRGLQSPIGSREAYGIKGSAYTNVTETMLVQRSVGGSGRFTKKRLQLLISHPNGKSLHV